MPEKASILIVDDEVKLCHYLRKELLRKGYGAVAVHDVDSALRSAEEQRVDVALVDIVMPGAGGLDLLRELRRLHPMIQVIVVTGNASVETAIEAMKLGAYDYLSKPVNFEELCLLADRACAETQIRRENEVLRIQIAREHQQDEFVGQHPEMLKLKALLRKVGPTDSPVLCRGETGTGKELAARMLHRESRVRNGPFVALNCAAFQESLLESELFGHEKGSFTGACSRKPGLIEVAEGGTLFLDELGAMSPGLQAKLLRFLDAGEYRRLGGTQDLRSNARIVSATNQDLAKEIAAGKFRKDLFYRVNVVGITVPPLRDRLDDLPLLVEHFLGVCAARRAGERKRLDEPALRALSGYRWPGNIRELANVLERAAIMADGPVIGPEDLCLQPHGPGVEGPDDPSLAAMEKAHILRVLTRLEGNKTKAAAALGIDIKTLYNKLKEYQS